MKYAGLILGMLLVLGPSRGFAQLETNPPSTGVVAQAESQQSVVQGSQITLEELVREALAKNPAIQSADRRVAALRARVPQARTLPDPVLSVGWAGNILPFDVQRGDPSSNRGITASQEFPYPGKLKLRGQLADREAEAARWDTETVRRQVTAEVKATYYDYFYSYKAIEIARKNQDLLDKFVKIAEARYRVGKGIQQDVLKAQVEFSRLLQRLTILEQQQKTAIVRLNTLLYREPDSPLPPPAPFEKAELTYTLESLYQLARQNDAQLQREERLIERSQVAVNLARKEYYPNFGVNFMYQNRPAMPEMYGVTVSLNLPVFYKTRQRQGVQEATEDLIGSQRSRDSRTTNLYFEVKEPYLAAKAADELAKLYVRAIVPQSTLALESSLAAYQVGSLDFLSLITNFTTTLDYETGYYEQLAGYQKALARLEVVTGIELTK